MNDQTALPSIAHFLLWFDKNLYPGPEDAARALIQRLTHDGYSVVRAPGTAPGPQNGEWWVCCHAQDSARLAGPQNVPPSDRIVAYYNALGDEPIWELPGAGGFRQHWLVPVRKIEL